MGKGLFTYTTEVTQKKSLDAIETMLIQAGATAILKEYAPQPAGEVAALSFRIKTEFGVLPFRLPARIDHVFVTIRQQAAKGAMPLTWVTRDQAGRVAWRVVFHWLEAQLAMIQVGNAVLEQVMLPYAQQSSDGRSFFEIVQEKRFALGGVTLALPAPEK